MNDTLSEALAYFSIQGNGGWHWTDDGNVLAWLDGTTICYREEIIGILERLAPGRWPSFGRGRHRMKHTLRLR